MTSLPHTEDAKRPVLVKRLWQLLAVAISSTAALVSVLKFAQENLGAAGGAPVAFIAAKTVAWVRTTPDVDTASALGDTVRFAATVADRNGSTLNAAPVFWTTSDSAVATVDSHGQVTARGAGTATITATAGEHAAQSRVVVRQAVAAVAVVVPGDTVVRMGEGESRGLVARAADRRGYIVSGRRAAWRTADTTIAQVDSTGRIEARGVGRTLVIASVEGSAAEVPVVVRAVPASLARVAPTADGGLLGPAGRTLPQKVTVRVLSQRGEPAKDVPVRFAVSDEGRTEPEVARTGADGVAAATWTLGARPGRQRLVASVEGLDSTLVMVAEADPVPSQAKLTTLSTELAGRVREPLAQQAAVRLVDTEGRPLPDVPLAWHADNGGTVANGDARTDSLGEGRASWTLGPTTGRQRLRVQAGSARAMPPHALVATASAGPPVKVVLAGGGSQAAKVGGALTQPIRVRVTDAGGNAVAGARVMVLAASGSVRDSVVSTDSSGVASVRWTLGRAAGQQQLLARPEGVEPALVVTAMARPRAATNIEADTLPATVPGGRPLPVRVTVRDEFGNAVPDARLQLAPGAGSGTVSPRVAVTGQDGTVAATWTLGRTEGDQRLEVRLEGTKVITSLSTTATAAPAAKPVATKPAAATPTKSLTKPAASKTTTKPTTRPASKSTTKKPATKTTARRTASRS